MKAVFAFFIIYLSFGVFCTVFLACDKQDTPPVNSTTPIGQLEMIGSHDLAITEPSGLSFGPTHSTLLIVSDNTNNIYETDLEGTLLRELIFTGSDLEGVTYNPFEQIIAITEERKREVVFLSYETSDELATHPINVEIGSDNAGLEGISFNPNSRVYYMVNENNPGQLILWNTQFGIIDKIDLNFAADYSAIYVDTENAWLWIVSDQSKKLYKTNFNAEVLIEYPLDQSKYEGITIDIENQLIYLVNDATAQLTIYKIID